MVGQQLRVLRLQRQRAAVSTAGLGKALQEGVRAGQHRPALGVAGLWRRLALELLGELLDHFFDLRHRRLAALHGLGLHRARVERGHVALDGVDAQRKQRDHRAQHQRRAARRAGLARAVGDRFFVEHAALDLATRQAVLLRRDTAGVSLGIELRKLLAQDGQVGAARVRQRDIGRRRSAARTKQRGQHQQQRQHQQCDGSDPEDDQGRFTLGARLVRAVRAHVAPVPGSASERPGSACACGCSWPARRQRPAAARTAPPTAAPWSH